MAIEYEKLITVLEEIAPPELTESWITVVYRFTVVKNIYIVYC